MKAFSPSIGRVLAVAIALVASACAQQEAGPGPGGGQRPPTPVVGFEAQQGPVADKISLVGNLAANESVQISSNVDGFIAAIAFEEGQSVAKDDTLVTLDQAKLRAEKDRAQADLQLAETTLERYRSLDASGAIAKQEVERVVAEHAAAQADLNVAKENFDDTMITAPFDGIMGARLVSPGQFVQRGMVLSTLISQDPMKAEFRVPERFLKQINIGHKVDVTLAAFPDETFSGEVYFVDPQLDERTRTVLVKARIPNPEGRLRRGMFANLDLITTVKENAVLIPESALMWKQDNAMVYVVDAQGAAEMRPVRTGIRQAGFVEILSGVAAGDTVIVEGFQKIGPGAPVAVRIEERPLPGA